MSDLPKMQALTHLRGTNFSLSRQKWKLGQTNTNQGQISTQGILIEFTSGRPKYESMNIIYYIVSFYHYSHYPFH